MSAANAIDGVPLEGIARVLYEDLARGLDAVVLMTAVRLDVRADELVLEHHTDADGTVVRVLRRSVAEAAAAEHARLRKVARDEALAEARAAVRSVHDAVCQAPGASEFMAGKEAGAESCVEAIEALLGGS